MAGLGIAAIWFIVFVFLAVYLKIKFIPASDPESAILVAERLKKEGFVPIINFLGEHCTTKTEADKAVKKYISLIDAIKNNNLNAKISVKPTQIGLAVSEEFYFVNLHWLARRAHNQGVLLEVDVESLKYLDAILKVFFKIPGEFGVRQAIQSYLRRSRDDIKVLIDCRKKVRLVKGAYSESDLSVDERAEQLLALTAELLLRGREPAIATVRDKDLINFLDNMRQWHKVPNGNFTIQMLYGRNDGLKRELCDKGFRVEIYTPVGPWYKALPYVWRRAKELFKNYFD